MKKKCSIPLILLLCLAASLCFIPIKSYADESSSEQFVEVPVYDSLEEYSEAVQSEETRKGTVEPKASALTVAVVRTDAFGNCQVMAHWTGTELINTIRFQRLIVKNQSYIVTTTYLDMFRNGGWFSYYPTAAYTGTVTFSNLVVPTDQSRVLVKFGNLQVYSLSGGWLSYTPPNELVPVI